MQPAETTGQAVPRSPIVEQVLMKPRVLTLIDTLYIGGAGKVILQFLKHADHSRFDYLLCNFTYARQKSREFIDRAQALGFNLHLLPQRHALDPSPIAAVTRLIDTGGFNLIETHGYKAHTVGWSVRARRPIRWITVSHGWTNEGHKMHLYNALDRWLIRRADLAIGVSPQLGATLRALRGPGRPTEVLLNAIDPDDLQPGAGPELSAKPLLRAATVTVGCFGRLSPEKGHVHLLRAWAHLPTSLDAHLILVGNGLERANLQAEAARLGITERVTFTGHQSDMAPWYATIDLLVLPSLSEGLPFVVLEAMATGKPVLATDVGAIREVITDEVNGWIVPPGDEAALARQILRLLSAPDALPEFGARARASLFPKFAPATHAERLLELYARTLRQ